MMKKYAIFSFVILTAFITGWSSAAAQTTTIFQKTVESLETLVGAKDDQTENLALRLQTFNQVIDLSLAEAKELKLKLFNLGKIDKKTDQWLADRIAQIDKAIDYYADQKKMVAGQDPLTLEWVKNAAQTFKEWRDQNYLPLAEELTDLLLIQQEKKAIETAGLRFQKISRDLENLVGKKGIKSEDLRPTLELMVKADAAIKNSIILNETAVASFWQPATTTSSTAALASPNLSIKDLVRDSLVKIREAYQIFIEVSKIVRELLT